MKTFTMLTTDKGLKLTAIGRAADGTTQAPLVQPSPNQDLLWAVDTQGVVAVSEIPQTANCNFTPLGAGTVTVTCSGNSLTGGAAVQGQCQIVVTAPAPPAATSIDFTATPLT